MSVEIVTAVLSKFAFSFFLFQSFGLGAGAKYPRRAEIVMLVRIGELHFQRMRLPRCVFSLGGRKM